MYLTYWPGVILKARQICPFALCYSIKGVSRLYERNCIHVTVEFPDKPPPAGPVARTMVSYRHSMCGALFLYQQIGWNQISRKVVDMMIDPQNPWQNTDGGWAHRDTDGNESDLWGSAYALRLLECVLQSEDSFFESERKCAEDAFTSTQGYLRSAWRTEKWRYGRARSEENAVNLFIDVAKVLGRHDSSLQHDVITWLHSCLSPSGDLSEQYLVAFRNSDIDSPRLSARMAYALFRVGEPNWTKLFETVISSRGESLNSAEMAFMIDLTYEFQGLSVSGGSKAILEI